MSILTRAKVAVCSYFLFAGAVLAVWAVHIPLIEQKTGITHALLGVLLVAAGFGGFFAMQVAGWAIDHIGAKTTTKWGGVLVGLSLLGPAYAVDAFTLGLAIFGLGFGLAAADVPVNAAALQVEKANGRAIFSFFHAFWSLGGLVGASIGWQTIGAGISTEITLTVSSIAVVIFSLLIAPWLLENQVVIGTTSKQEKLVASKLNRKVLGFVILAGALACSAAIVEGIANDWSALYFVDTFSTDESFAALGLAVFSIGMVLGRLFIDRIVEAKGRLPVIQIGTYLAAGVVVILMFSPNQWVSLFAWFAIGVSLSGVVPQIFAMGGEVGESTHAGRNMAKVVGITYLGALIGPSIIGILTIWMPLNFAFVWAFLLALFVAVVSPKLESMGN